MLDPVPDCSIYRPHSSRLKQEPYQAVPPCRWRPSTLEARPRGSGVAVDQGSGDADAARQRGELTHGILGHDRAVRRVYLLNQLGARGGIHAKLIGSPRIVEMLVQQGDLRLYVGVAHRRGGFDLGDGRIRPHRRGRRCRRVAAGRQRLAADLLHRSYCRRLTSLHEARRRYLDRIAVARHLCTCFNRYWLRVPAIASVAGGPGAVARAAARLTWPIARPTTIALSISSTASESAAVPGWPAPTPRYRPVPTPAPESGSPFPARSSHPEWCCAIGSGSGSWTAGC